LTDLNKTVGITNLEFCFGSGGADADVTFFAHGQRVRLLRLRETYAAERGDYHQSESKETQSIETTGSPVGWFCGRQDWLEVDRRVLHAGDSPVEVLFKARLRSSTG
jgi:hypothetical protein